MHLFDNYATMVQCSDLFLIHLYAEYQRHSLNPAKVDNFKDVYVKFDVYPYRCDWWYDISNRELIG